MKNKLILGISALILILFIVSIGLFKKNGNQATGKIQFTTSFYPLYFFTTQIVGDKAMVYNVTPAGAEPHDYEPTTQDVARIEDSKLLILNGGKLEAWGEKIKDTLKGTGTSVIAVGEDIANQTVVENNNTVRDPHVWLDPMLAKKEVLAITQSLSEIDSANVAFYQANAKIIQGKLDDLDAEYRSGLKNCLQKDIITSHAAFGYLAREYGLNQISIAGFSPDAEPSPQKLAEVADFAKKNNIKYIFFESLVSPKLSETIADEIGAKTLVLNPIEGLSGSDLTQGKNYLTEMENNLKNLKIALQCQ